MLETKAASADSSVTLLVPEDDVDEPELSIVIPALNEELTVGEFVEWCKQGLEKAGIEGEIVIVDSSDDSTAEIALAHGARVLKTPRRGLGRAYIDAIPYIRGQYVLMGDADPASLLRDARDDVDPEPRLLEQVLGHPLRHARHHTRRPRAHGSPLAVMGVRVRDDPEVGAHGAADSRGSGVVPQGPRRAIEPPQALGLVLAVGGGLDQSARHVRLRLGLLRLQTRTRLGRD